MEEYVSRDYLLGEYDRQHQGPPGGARKIIAEAPAADVAPVRHGRWIDRPSKRGYGMSTYCSCCGQHSGIGGIKSNRHRAYCPNCGAKMHRGQDDV